MSNSWPVKCDALEIKAYLRDSLLKGKTGHESHRTGHADATLIDSILIASQIFYNDKYCSV